MYGGLGRGFWQAGQVFTLNDLRSKARVGYQRVMPMSDKIDEPAGKAEETADWGAKKGTDAFFSRYRSGSGF